MSFLLPNSPIPSTTPKSAPRVSGRPQRGLNRVQRGLRLCLLVVGLGIVGPGFAPKGVFAGTGEGQSEHGKAKASPYAVTKVVIDAGHGGHDHGCSGKHSREKHVALEIALKVGGYITEHLPDVEVIYTRKTDVFVELHERAAIANRAQADVFISIHCNANANPRPYGTETYVMGLHRNEANLNVAKRENAVITMEDDYNHHYDGFDPNDPSAHIIFTLFQGAHLEQSIELAGRVEEQFAERVGRKSRGVKQAGFLVLYKTTMPAVLIETGFLTNVGEENFLTSDEGKTYMASAIYRAFRDYKIHTETKARIAPASLPEVPLAQDNPVEEAKPAPVPESDATEEPPSANATPNKAAPDETVAVNPPPKPQTKPIATKPVVKAPEKEPVVENRTAVDALDTAAGQRVVITKDIPTSAEQAAEDAAATPEAFAEEAKPAPSESLKGITAADTGTSNPAAADEAPTASAETKAAAKMDTQETVYRVQVYASHRKYRSTDPLFKPLTGEDLFRAQEGNLFKYMVGGFADRNAAVAKQAELRQKGYEDCFIVTQEYAVLAAQ